MKTLRIEKKEYLRTGYDPHDIDIVEYTELTAEYNDNGLLTREERFNHDGSRNTLTLNVYNDNGKLLLTEQYDQDNILLQKTENSYDEDGNILSQTNYFGDASDKYTSKYIYNDHKNLERIEVYFNDELDYVEKTFTYNDGYVDTEIENDDYGEVMYSTRYEYNEKGLLSKLTRDEIQNKDRRVYEFYYNDNGDRVKDLVYDYGMKLIAKTNRNFDEQHRLLGYIEEDLDNYREIKIEHKDNLVVKNSILDINSQIISWAEYEYDENGKEIHSMEYARDEVAPEKYRVIQETNFIRG